MADSQYMPRRALLKGLPAAAGAALALPKAADASESPIIGLFREWEEARAFADLEATSEEESNAALDRMILIENQMLDLPSRDILDLAAKTAAFTSFGDFGFPEGGCRIMSEIRQLLA